jgi:hypothetical protein
MIADHSVVTCPQCNRQADLDGFDVLGACMGNVFCTACHCEFDVYTRAVHDEESCLQCEVEREISQ